MTEYAKILENGNLEYAPRDIPGVSNWGLNEANVLAAGYLPVDSVVAPKGKQQAGWKIENDRIVPVFTAISEPSYLELRRQAYPDITDQLDMIYWDQVNGTNLWRKTIAAVKSKYPKPETTEGNTKNA